MDNILFDLIMKRGYKKTSVPILDLENSIVDGEKEYQNYTFKDCLALYLIDKYSSKGYELLCPRYKTEIFTLLARKDEEEIIIHLLLDSEEERVMWRMSELSNSKYKLILIRDRKENEIENIEGIALAEVL